MTADTARPGERIVSGRIKVHPDGYGFVVPDDKSEDIHVSARARGAALDADRVEVEWWVGTRGLEGRVRRVLERGRGKLTGVLTGAGNQLRFVPDDARISSPVLLRGGPGGARGGQAVVARILRYPEHPEDGLEVEMLRVLGDPDDPRTEVEKVLAVADIEEAFPPEVERLAAAVPDRVQASDVADREDLRHIPFCTIDPETARDFDDAVAFEPLAGGGHRLWVAVADVSHYVREGTAIDQEARRRGVSVYLPNRAIPMLPERLSSHMCSLVPEQDRLAMVVRIDFDGAATVRGTDFCAAVIRSRARLDYPGVAAALGGDLRGPRQKYAPFVESLRAMDAFARRLRTKRFARGALDLDLPEPVIELDRDDPRLVRDVRRSRRDPGERAAYALIEEFMLAANEAVGDSFARAQEDVVWRIHDVPADAKLEDFAALAEHYGLPFDREEARTPRGLVALLERLKDHPAGKPLAFQLLRSLKQAAYDVVNVGHFGLASSAYIHFTSPIRRYPDVVAHRLLKQRLAAQRKPAGGFRAGGRAQTAAELNGVAAESSFAERRALEAEREVTDLYRAYFLRDRIGDVFDGTISGVTSFGLFVTVDEPFVEGLVRADDLGRERFTFDERSLRLIGERSGRAFALGDAVKVEVQSVSVARRRIEFRMHEHRASETSARHEPPGRRRQGRGRGPKGRERHRQAHAGGHGHGDGHAHDDARGHAHGARKGKHREERKPAHKEGRKRHGGGPKRGRGGGGRRRG